MTTVMKANDSAGFLGLGPALAGYTPTRSLVLLPFHGTRTHGAMRMDLPDPALHEEIDGWDDCADAALSLVRRVPEADAVAVVIYTDDEIIDVPDGLVVPNAPLVDALLDVTEDLGLRMVDALCVAPNGWASYIADEPRLTPIDSIPMQPALDGDDLSRDHTAGTELPHVDLVEKERVGRALAELRGVLCRMSTGAPSTAQNPQALAASLLLDDIPQLFEAALEAPDDLGPFSTAALAWCLNRPLMRDAALVQWARDLAFGYRALDAQVAYTEDGVPLPEEIGETFMGRGRRPDADRLRAALELVRHTAARVPLADRAAVLACAGWLSWALGRSSHADVYLRQAHEIDPDHSLTNLLQQVIAAVGLPSWAFDRGPTVGE